VCTYPTVTHNADGSTTYTYADADGEGYVFRPPPDFDPLTATNEELRRYGLPTRPHSTARIKKWEKQVVRTAKNSFADPPGPTCAMTGNYAG